MNPSAMACNYVLIRSSGIHYIYIYIDLRQQAEVVNYTLTHLYATREIYNHMQLCVTSFPTIHPDIVGTHTHKTSQNNQQHNLKPRKPRQKTCLNNICLDLLSQPPDLTNVFHIMPCTQLRYRSVL